jgi:hypothetical protein
LYEPIDYHISIAQSVLFGHSHILEVTQNLSPRGLVLFILLRRSRGYSFKRRNTLFPMPSFVIVLQALKCLQYEDLVVDHQRGIEAV